MRFFSHTLLNLSVHNAWICSQMSSLQFLTVVSTVSAKIYEAAFNPQIYEMFALKVHFGAGIARAKTCTSPHHGGLTGLGGTEKGTECILQRAYKSGGSLLINTTVLWYCPKTLQYAPVLSCYTLNSSPYIQISLEMLCILTRLLNQV